MKSSMSRLVKGVTGTKTTDLISKADAFRDNGDWQDAVTGYKAVLDVNDRLPHIWVQYGHALKESGQLKEAEEAYLKAMVLRDDGDIHLQLGHLHKRMGRVREAEEDYLHALEREPEHADARSELARLGWNSKRLRTRLASAAKAEEGEEGGASVECAFVAFELSDLIDHLQGNPHPSGIQRVQLEMGAALATTAAEDQIQFVYYDNLLSGFFEIPIRHVIDIFHLVDTSEGSGAALSEKIRRLKSDILSSRPFEFPDGAYLINVGTSWGFLNYFLTLRDLKRRSNVRFVPLVHDCIPLIYPEFCIPNLVRDFINWITLMIGHADLVLTNSENTKKDLMKVADDLGEKLAPTSAVYLNGEYGRRIDEAEIDRSATAMLQAHNLDVEDFVLFVSTIEPRKNHMLVLNAWSRMIKARVAGSVPRLVCVGSSGWMNEAFQQRLDADQLLRERVVVMRNVPDQVLQLLYRKSLFTVFPSLYEGWGLPISEALSYGKVPLVSRVSAHTEAGGDLAVYFDLSSEADFQAKLEALIDDVEMRRERENQISKSQPLRPWSEIVKQVLGIVRADLATSPAELSPKTKTAPALTCGRYYAFARNTQINIQSLVYNGDMFLSGMNWLGAEPWGTWIRGKSGDIEFSLEEEGDEFLVFLRWNSSNNIDNTATISVPPSNWLKTVHMPARHAGWELIHVKFLPGSRREVRIRITAEHLDDFAKVSDGRDQRVSSVGISGIYVCGPGNEVQRGAIIEAIELNNMDMVARRFPRTANL